jgi:hypothetical protein
LRETVRAPAKCPEFKLVPPATPDGRNTGLDAQILLIRRYRIWLISNERPEDLRPHYSIEFKLQS